MNARRRRQRNRPTRAWTRGLCWQRLDCDLPRGLIFSWFAGSSAAPRTSRPHNGCSRPIGSPHVSCVGMGVSLERLGHGGYASQ